VDATPVLPQAGLKIEEHFLSNGMKVLLVPRHLSPTVAGGGLNGAPWRSVAGYKARPTRSDRSTVHVGGK
jgi:hypothetical protein